MTDWWESGTWPVAKGDEIQSAHSKDIRKRMWLLMNPYAGNIDTTIEYGKWNGNTETFEFIDYEWSNWPYWPPANEYNPGELRVKYRWGEEANQIDIFVLKIYMTGTTLNNAPPVFPPDWPVEWARGCLNDDVWLLTTDPNKYHHWDFNAGRLDIPQITGWLPVGRYHIVNHGSDTDYGIWPAYMRLPQQTDPYEQIKPIKDGESIFRRHYPLEQNRLHDTKFLDTQTIRRYQDSVVGVEETPWYHSADWPAISEYIFSGGEPAESSQVGGVVDLREEKINKAYQDNIQHLIEQFFNYAVEVDTHWKQSWRYWHLFGTEMDTENCNDCYGAVFDYVWGVPLVWDWETHYAKGACAIHNNKYWRSIWPTTNENHEPTEESEYWVSELYVPDYFKTDPVYVQFSDYLHHCNSSAFEKVLKEIGNYDWYWDANAAVPWWMYQKHYYLMTLHLADPEAGWDVLAEQRYPIPRGCWRRIWRYTMSWDETRSQKSRYGKEITIGGKQVAMMWPGELGTPPGYDDQLYWEGVVGVAKNWWRFHHVITQAQWDDMERPPATPWLYDQYYKVVDVEALFTTAYQGSALVESYIAERHDPKVIEYEGELEIPIFEIYHDMINDMRDALLQLKVVKQESYVSSASYQSIAQLIEQPTSLAAYTAGKAYCEAETNSYEGGSFVEVGYIGAVAYRGVEDYCTYTISHDWQMTKAWVEVTIRKEGNCVFPAEEVGTMVLDVYACSSLAGWQVDESCLIGAGEFTYLPPADGQLRRAWLGNVPISTEWVHTGAGGDPEDWQLRGTFRIAPAEEWMDSDYFDFEGNGTTVKEWGRSAAVDVDTGADQSLAWSINFDGYAADVFELDETNVIEI